jgi:nitrite reductase/ring-hydroxylating ferredoxin subunit
MTWIDVGRGDLPDGELRDVTAGPLRLALARVGEEAFAFDAWCPHAECPLTDGWLEGGAVRCACHGSLFDLATGEALDGPADEPLRTYPARVVDGRVEVELP